MKGCKEGKKVLSCQSLITRRFFLLTDDEGSGSDVGKKFTKCSTCKYGAECDEDSEDVW